MKTLVIGDCATETTFRLLDPDSISETEFEYSVVKALKCAYPAYECIVFSGTFTHPDSGARRPDLALIARDLSHWFVIEVELTSHSLDQHVLPQVRAFVFGEPQSDCASIIASSLHIPRAQAEIFVRRVPRSVAVVANRWKPEWNYALRALPAQLLTIYRLKTEHGVDALEIEGGLRVVLESLGFGRYSAVDRSLRFHPRIRLPRGDIQLVDDEGAAAMWRVVEANEIVWVTKMAGIPDFVDGTFAQIVRTSDGSLLLRASPLAAKGGR